MMRSPTPSGAGPRDGAVGLAYAVAAFVFWGLAPIYFKALQAVPPTEIVAHRAVWSLLLVGVLVLLGRRWDELRAALAPASSRAVFACTSALISCNWLTFIWATNSGRLLEASLGYFINPLVNVLLGVVFLQETLTRPQKIAVALAAVGVLNLAVNVGTFPWVSLTVAVSFGLYGLLRKRVPADSTVGLFVETALLTPVALAYLLYLEATGELAFGHGAISRDLLLGSAGVMTALPLLWFVAGARRLKLATVGLLQYLAPTIQFLLAVAFYGEPFTVDHGVTFGMIWTSLVLYSASALSARGGGTAAA
jgi:chloramphenicol-sensitive protein RarD